MARLPRSVWISLSLALSFLLVASALLAFYPMPRLTPQQTSPDAADLPTKQSVLEAYGRLPLLFIPNQGQIDGRVKFYLKTSGQTLYLTTEGIVFDLIRYEKAGAGERIDRKAERLVFSLDFIGANTQPSIEGSVKHSAVVNYLIGNDPQKWHTNIPTYREVVYHDIYPNIDLRLYGSGSRLRYDFIVRPEASPENISLAYRGVEGIEITDGELLVRTAFGNIVQSKPYIYQQIGGETVQIDGGFRLVDDRSYGFYVAAYNNSYPLIIDPSLAYSTYLGGSDADSGFGIAVDSSGCAYVTGITSSTNFPTLNPYQGANAGGCDAFVTKLSAAGNSLIYSTYLGGSDNDGGYGIAVDTSGCAYVTGWTLSANFPTTPGAFDTHADSSDAFVTKLDTAKSGAASLIYSTYLGGSGSDRGKSIAVDANGNTYIAGETDSNDFPVRSAYQTRKQGTQDTFVSVLSPAGNYLTYSTYLGSLGWDSAGGIAVDAYGCAYVTGSAGGPDFPTTPQAYDTSFNGLSDVFVTKLDTTRSGNASLVYSTYIGGSDNDHGWDIAVDSSGCAYVTGDTDSGNFPTQTAYQTAQGQTDAFVTVLSSEGDSLIYSTYLGGSYADSGFGIAVDSSGCAYVTGETASTNFPTLNPYQGANAGSYDAFVAKFWATMPAITGTYATTCSIKLYDWMCNRLTPITGGTLYITWQSGHKVKGYWQPDVVPEGWPTLVPVNGYVGPFVRIDGKVKNTPRVSLLLEVGGYCQYPTTKYVTYVLNGKIKWDKKLNKVKSIKGTISGWGEYGPCGWCLLPITPSQGQFEGKFTATPLADPPGGLPPAATEGSTATEKPEPTWILMEEIPIVLGDYPFTGSIKFYDWKGNRLLTVQNGTLHITTQDRHKVYGSITLDGVSCPAVGDMVGYVGPVDRVDNKVKNTPRLSLMVDLGEYGKYPSSCHVTYIINARVKLDKNTEPPVVKSIKGTIYGWGEWGAEDPDEPGAPLMGQFEGKFTATLSP